MVSNKSEGEGGGLSVMLLAKHIWIDGPGPHGWVMRAANCAATGCSQEWNKVTPEPACALSTPTWTEVFGTRPVLVFGAKLSLRAKETEAYCARSTLSLSGASRTSLASTLT